MSRKMRFWLAGVITVCFVLALFALSADADETLEAGKETAEAFLLDAQQAAEAADPAVIVPGFPSGDPTELPETSYYDSQDVGEMETNAFIAIDENDTNAFLREQSLRPKLEFGQNHPILENADAIGENTVSTAESGSLTTCETDVSTTTDHIIDTCLSSLTPEDHSCERTLDVAVTWEDQTNCPVGEGFAQQSAVINYRNQDDYVSARAYCNPGAAPGTVEIEAYGWDGGYTLECGGWNRYTVPNGAPGATHYLGTFDASYVRSGCDEHLVTTAQGGCTSGQCQYTLLFRQAASWQFDGGNRSDTWYCTGSVLTYPGWSGLSENTFRGLFGYRHPGLCIARSQSVTLVFEEPETTRVATVTDEWQDGCASYAARTRP